MHSGNSVTKAVAKFTVLQLFASKSLSTKSPLGNVSWHQSKTTSPRYTRISQSCLTTYTCTIIKSNDIYIPPIYHLPSFVLILTDSCIDRSPAICFNTVNAAVPMWSRDNIIHVSSNHMRVSKARAIDLG